MARHTWRYFDYDASCQDCEWSSSFKNALGNAAQHHDRTGHKVTIEIEGSVTYVNDKEHARICKEKGVAP